MRRYVSSSSTWTSRRHVEFLYALDYDFAHALGERAAEAEMMLENLRDIEGTLRDLDRGKIRIQ